MIVKNQVFILGFLMLFFHSVNAQNSGVMLEANRLAKDGKGVVVCAIIDENNQPLEYATITVLKSDSSMVAGGITNEKGVVLISDIPYGSYMVRIGYIGYQSIFVNDVKITKENPVNNIGKQKITQNAQKLQGVVVTAEKAMIETNLDKRVYNVDKSIVTEGSTGSDILENIPSVSIDLDGNVSLRGSSSVTILVDGRPTTLTMDDIPADMIESVEVVTNPSARYEPDGISGIINVVLKKKRALGFNMSVKLGAGMSDDNKNVYFGKYNAGINLNLRVKKMNFFLNYNFHQFSFHNSTDLNRTNVFDNDTSYLEQYSEGGMKGSPQNLRGGIDYFINDNNTISFEIGYRRHSRISENTLNSLTKNVLSDTTSFYDQHSSMPKIPNHSFNASLNYYHTSPKVKGRELIVDINFSTRNNLDSNAIFKNYYAPSIYDYCQLTSTKEQQPRLDAQVDFVTPIGNGGRLETGYKLRYRFEDEKYTYYLGTTPEDVILDTNRNEYSQYTDIVNAAYLIYSNTIKEKFKYQLGVRAELAKNISKLQSDPEVFSPRPYFNVFPTIHLRYDFNDKHSLQLSYSMRVRRPRGRELNPFINDEDRLNISQGNRKLKPEYTQSLDLGYLYAYKKTSVSANVFYRYRYNIISRYTILINDSTTYTTFENLDNSHSYGLELSYQQGLWKFWNLTLNTSMYQSFVNADSLYDESLRRDLVWQVRWNNNFSLPLDFQLQLSANYRSPTLTLNSMGHESGGAGQGRMSAMWNVDFGIKKSFLKKSLSISLRVSDIFNSRQARVYSYGTTSKSAYESQMIRFRDSRQFWLTLTYNFSTMKSKMQTKRRVVEEDYEDEMY